MECEVSKTNVYIRVSMVLCDECYLNGGVADWV